MTGIRTRVGVVGLGIMGLAIARNLKKSGCAVMGYDIDPERVEPARLAGVEWATSPFKMSRSVDVVLSSLPNDAALTAVVDSLASAPVGSNSNLVVVELSTLSLECKLRCRERLRERGIVMLDCPISGTGAQAQTGDLALYASGDPEDYQRVAALLTRFSRVCTLVGPFGDGMRLKLVANLLVAIHNVATAEAMDLAERAGLNLEQTLERLQAGGATSRILELRGPLMLRGSYEPPTMKLGVWKKDLELIASFAADCGAPVTLFRSTLASYAAALAEGRSAQDTAAVFEVLRAQ